MRIETLIIIGTLLLFFGLILGIVYFLPILITKWRAAALGLTLTIRQSKEINTNFCNTRNFLSGAKEIWFWADIPLEELIRHYSAKGDMANLVEGVILMKQKNREIEIRVLSTFDIGGRDLKEEIRKAEMNNWTFSWGE